MNPGSCATCLRTTSTPWSIRVLDLTIMEKGSDDATWNTVGKMRGRVTTSCLRTVSSASIRVLSCVVIESLSRFSEWSKRYSMVSARIRLHSDHSQFTIHKTCTLPYHHQSMHVVPLYEEIQIHKQVASGDVEGRMLFPGERKGEVDGFK